MTLSLPIWIQEQPAPGGETLFIAQPLFHAAPQERGVKLSRVLTRLTAELQKRLTELGKEPRHEEIAEWLQLPNLESTTLEVRLETKSGTALRPFLFVGWPSLDRKLFFTPSFPDLRFEVTSSQQLAERAAQVIERYLRNAERDGGPVELSTLGLLGKAWLAFVEVSFEPGHKIQAPKRPERAFLGGPETEKPDGPTELQRTSRRLNDQFPDDLDRAVGRDTEVAELLRRFDSKERRPLLLLGPRKTGKTAILHETVWRMESLKRKRAASGSAPSPADSNETGSYRTVWHIAPMRLISGMSYLGQWENRVLSILDYASARDVVLYIDDLLGLFSAGISASSDLNIAAVLKPFLERQSLRLIAEITPEAWRILRERDRAFSELFQVLPVRELAPRDTLEVLVTFARDLEARHHCKFTNDVVPLTVDLHRRFIRDAAFPGKAAGFLRRLAARATGREAGRTETLEEFQQQSGLMIALLNDRRGLARSSILESLGRELAGQPAILEAFADTISLLKARLNDPVRPLATFLLLGPTGVGKTQSAKALAQFLFGSSQRLLRFDMNEYVQPSSVMRLAGTPSEPEGLLTSAVRRQPFCVILFDEIEKAAPEVFDVLLAVLDEGRLTDALGRVADFTNAIILLTSNLGAREARATLGFGAGGVDEGAIYRSAAEKFFRPEFFNRLDRILPFQGLSTEHLQQIAERLISDVFARQGLRQRDCLLNVTPEAKARLVELGRHPQLGARALKRVVERELAQPIAERLAAMAPGLPMQVEFHFDGSQFQLSLHGIRPAGRTATWSDHLTGWLNRTLTANLQVEQVMDRVRETLDRVEEQLDAVPIQQRLELGHVPPEQAKVIFCREQLREVDRLLQLTEATLKPSKKKTVRVLNTARARSVNLALVRRFYVGDPRPDSLRAAESLRFDLNEIHEPDDTTELPDSPLAALLREVALLEVMVKAPSEEPPLTLVFQSSQASQVGGPLRVANLFRKALEKCWGYSAKPVWPQMDNPTEYILEASMPDRSRLCFPSLLVQGPGIRSLLAVHMGLHLQRAKDGGLTMFHAQMLELPTLEAARATFETWDLSKNKPTTLPLAVCEYFEGRGYTHFRSGLRLPNDPTPEEWRASLLSALPLPGLELPAEPTTR